MPTSNSRGNCGRELISAEASFRAECATTPGMRFSFNRIRLWRQREIDTWFTVYRGDESECNRYSAGHVSDHLHHCCRRTWPCEDNAATPTENAINVSKVRVDYGAYCARPD